ncbi:PAS domain S-box-containing protein [Caulobacter ginsengisoli]|uniref:histidine kinase n=1 Tax=Caulobacter ginsengisoli TaxID=400775 RepID=A0ABU0IX28_9CAUL|nr:ATP-binding protein [Caulobacter ginsengisoli]MDQ0466578.1 PAS domain S-box-containing protein [Caulobacter ginsengisoli]
MDSEGFEDLAQTVRTICDAPSVLIALGDDRRWVCGTDPGGAGWIGDLRDRIVGRDRHFIVGDLLADRQFSGVRQEAGQPTVRAFLGAPLVWEGQVLGALMVFDYRPRVWSAEAVTAFGRQGRLAAGLIGLQTGRRAAQDRLADAARDSNIIAVLSDGVVLHAADGQLIDANPAAARILGVSRDVLLGRKAADPRWRATTQSGEDLTADNHPTMQVVRTGRPARDFVVSIEAPGEGRRWLRVNAEPLFADGPDAPPTQVVATFADITSQTEAQDRQAALIADLEAARRATAAGLAAAETHSRAKTAFLANMSHELRTPLNGVVGVVDALAQTELDPRQQEMVRLVADSARSLERILSDILDLSRIEAGRLSLEETAIRLDEVTLSLCDIFRLKAEEKGLAFEVWIGEGLEEAVLGDAVRIRQVMANLISNAVKFTAQGGVRVALTRAGAPDPQGRRPVRIAVADTGPGFAPEIAGRLFERFEQADGSITRRFGGTGLGLAITRELIGLMDGEITVESEPGRGARFQVELPLRPAAEPVRAPQPAATPMDATLRILVVEDHPINRHVLQLMLEPFGFDLTFTENGREALEALEGLGREAFDVVLMDMQMPVMDGLTAIRLIRAGERGPRLPIAMLSANVGEEHEVAALQAGADVHIAKPVTLDSLLGGINRAMEAVEGRLLAAV